MIQTPKDRQEEEHEAELAPEEEAELALLLADYMKDGKVDFEKLDADSKPMDLDALIAALL